MTALTLDRDGTTLCATDTRVGRPVVFQHGLGGSEAQVAELFPDRDGLRRLTLECRGHGGSALGPTECLSIATFVGDVLALAERLGVPRFVAGGVSMGAALALRLAVRHPTRVAALVLVRPAWMFDAAPANMAPFALVAELLRAYPPERARDRFAATQAGATLRDTAPDNYASLLGFFDRRPLDATVALLSRIAVDGTGVSAAEAAALAVPTLVIGNAQDTVHPVAMARRLADAIPGAEFREVVAKATNRAAHADAVRAAIAIFVRSDSVQARWEATAP